MHNVILKILARIGAGLSFTSFLLAGMAILAKTNYQRSGEDALFTAVGLVFVGTAFFVGPMLWLTAEKYCPKQNGK